ncbi:MAG: copper resistance protein NlpE N-terminal domain-containing protein [Rubrivivax sp.]|nr:copper resistance protein NlpE N-terminal domain-containing protein [Rubrivivax sp.]
MRTLPLHAFVLALALALTACMPRQAAEGASVAADPAHSSRNSLDWAGTYEGVLPCADCPGIRTRLTLNRDESYELSTLTLDRDTAPRVVRGRFSWQPSGNAITLESQHGGQQFVVGEGRVALLAPGAAPSWPQPEQRVLQRVAAAPEAGVQRTLESHRWTLTSATGSQGQRIDGLPAGTVRPVVFGFAEGRLNIEGGCNRIFGGYRIDGDDRLVLGRMASTMMACEPAAMKVDATLSDLLAEPAKIELVPGADPVLRLVTASQAKLSFLGRMTPEARYGAPTRIFLEVAAQTVACTHPARGASNCLQVRERRFDAQGLAVGTPGAWQPFFEPIEGYAHQPGVRNVLRLKRFDRGASAGQSPFVYVLDLVVESEAVAR